ncbi:MAG: PepSY domain-containing protein [Caldimonas sp.]
MIRNSIRPNRTQQVRSIVGFIGMAAMCAATPVRAYTGENLAKFAKVSLEQARRTALAVRPGAIINQELEREPGGSGLRYSFDVRAGKVTQEVGVDAMTGHVLENKPEGAHPD